MLSQPVLFTLHSLSLSMKTDKTPLVSVYVATYNQEAYIRDCLDGIVKQQTDFPFEVIVVDDASTDSNPEIIKEYAERYPEIIRPVLLNENYYQQNRSKIFEIFFPMAQGKYMAFCEGDDYWTFPGKLQAQVDFLESHPKYSMCFHNYRVVNESILKEKSSHHYLLKNCRVTATELIINQLAQTATIVARISLLKDDSELSDFCRQMKYKFTDIRFCLSYLNSGKVYGMAKDWSVYRINNNGVSTIAATKHKDRTIHKQILEDLYQCYNSKFAFLRKRYIAREYLTTSAQLAEKRNFRKSIKYTLKALRISPLYFLQLSFHKYIHKRIMLYAPDFSDNSSI